MPASLRGRTRPANRVGNLHESPLSAPRYSGQIRRLADEIDYAIAVPGLDFLPDCLITSAVPDLDFPFLVPGLKSIRCLLAFGRHDNARLRQRRPLPGRPWNG